MPIRALKENLKKTSLITGCFLFVFISYLLAADKVYDEKEDQLTNFQLQAREYREQGLMAQNIGDLDSALKFYQKASEADPGYGIVFNDLGIIYEAKGMSDLAESSYLKAIKIDPYYLSTYSNLALFYESQRELSKAAACWRKRLELGDANDLWTLKAEQRLEDMNIVLDDRPIQNAREKEVVSLMNDVGNAKYVLIHDDRAMSKKKFRDAKLNYGKENYAAAIKEALDAQYLDPDNKEIEDFIEKTQSRALSR